MQAEWRFVEVGNLSKGFRGDNTTTDNLDIYRITWAAGQVELFSDCERGRRSTGLERRDNRLPRKTRPALLYAPSGKSGVGQWLSA